MNAIKSLLLAAGGSLILPSTAMGKGQKAVEANRQKTKIMYIMSDDMGYGDLGCYAQCFYAQHSPILYFNLSLPER